MSVTKIPALIKVIYSTVAELEQIFPHRKFTPDGILVGSIGEVLAAHHYALELLPQNHSNHDGRCPKGRFVQIKTTQRGSIDLRTQPDYLLVLKLHQNGACDEIYNGIGARVWNFLIKKPLPKAGFYTISLSRLAKLACEAKDEEKILRVQ